MSFGFWQIVVIALLGVLLFGRGRISELMGDVAKGIKSFKKGLTEDDNTPTDSPLKSKPNPQLEAEKDLVDISAKDTINTYTEK